MQTNANRHYRYLIAIINLLRRNGEATTQGIDKWLAMNQPSKVKRLKTIILAL